MASDACRACRAGVTLRTRVTSGSRDSCKTLRTRGSSLTRGALESVGAHWTRTEYASWTSWTRWSSDTGRTGGSVGTGGSGGTRGAHSCAGNTLRAIGTSCAGLTSVSCQTSLTSAASRASGRRTFRTSVAGITSGTSTTGATLETHWTIGAGTGRTGLTRATGSNGGASGTLVADRTARTRGARATSFTGCTTGAHLTRLAGPCVYTFGTRCTGGTCFAIVWAGLAGEGLQGVIGDGDVGCCADVLTCFHIIGCCRIVEGGHFSRTECAIVYSRFIDKPVHLVVVGDGVVSNAVVVVERHQINRG